MDRCVMIQIAGKEYPMSFSLAAAKKITGRFGSIKDAKKKAAGDSEKNIEDLIQIKTILKRTFQSRKTRQFRMVSGYQFQKKRLK